MKLVSVNELLEKPESFSAHYHYFHGVLNCVNDGFVLSHWPKAERTAGRYDQAWIYAGAVAIGLDPESLDRKDEKRVVVYGVANQFKTVWPDLPGAFWLVHIQSVEVTEHKLWCLRYQAPSA